MPTDILTTDDVAELPYPCTAMDSEFLTVDDLAALLRCEPAQVEQMTRNGELPGLKIGRQWVFPRQTLIRELNRMAIAEAAVRREAWLRQAQQQRDKPPAETPAERRARRAGLVRHHAGKRRACRLQRTPAWADMSAIRSIYEEARRLTVETGQPHHVDHIIPLQGAAVSGLHVAENLQILLGSDNIRKRNRYKVS